MTGLIAAGALALGLLVVAARRWGRAQAQRDAARKQSEVKDDQLEAALETPRDARALLDRLRRGGF